MPKVANYLYYSPKMMLKVVPVLLYANIVKSLYILQNYALGFLQNYAFFLRSTILVTQ